MTDVNTAIVLRCMTIAPLLCTAQLSHANVEVRFNESAPKDIFTIKNLSQCDLENLELDIDLSSSAGGLIFDTTAAGAGVEVFQPFEVRQGTIVLTSSKNVNDGDSGLSVSIDKITAGGSVSFTIDVDDTLAKGELGNIRVSGAEIEGGAASLHLPNNAPVNATFGSNSTAVFDWQAPC